MLNISDRPRLLTPQPQVIVHPVDSQTSAWATLVTRYSTAAFQAARLQGQEGPACEDRRRSAATLASRAVAGFIHGATDVTVALAAIDRDAPGGRRLVLSSTLTPYNDVSHRLSGLIAAEPLWPPRKDLLAPRLRAALQSEITTALDLVIMADQEHRGRIALQDAPRTPGLHPISTGLAIMILPPADAEDGRALARSLYKATGLDLAWHLRERPAYAILKDAPGLFEVRETDLLWHPGTGWHETGYYVATASRIIFRDVSGAPADLGQASEALRSRLRPAVSEAARNSFGERVAALQAALLEPARLQAQALALSA